MTQIQYLKKDKLLYHLNGINTNGSDAIEFLNFWGNNQFLYKIDKSSAIIWLQKIVKLLFLHQG